MDELEITEMKCEECVNSRFVVPSRVTFKQNGVKRTWDYIKAHDSVAIMIFNTTRQAFILVKQFRPALYMNFNRKANGEETSSIASTNEQQQLSNKIKTTAPYEQGVSYELCAGIVDQSRSLIEIAKSEIQEETGYEVPLDKIEKIFEHHAVGYAGNCGTLYYAEVTDEMKTHSGGGNRNEGEFIDIMYLPLCEAKEFVFDAKYPKPGSFIAAFCWYFMKHKIKSS